MEDTSFQKVLADLPGDEKIAVLELAHKYGIPEGDPVWHEVLLTREAVKAKTASCDAAQAAGEAADRVRDELRGLPEVIASGAAGGAERIKEIVSGAGETASTMVLSAGQRVGEALLAVFNNESSEFSRKLKIEASQARSDVLAEIERDLAKAVSRSAKTEWTKTLLLSIVSVLFFVGLALWAGYFVEKTNIETCVGGRIDNDSCIFPMSH